MPTDRSLCSKAMWGTRSYGTTTEVLRHLARLDVGDGSAITSFHTSDGTPSAPGALLFGVSRSASVIPVYLIELSHSG
ncbi:hypothetical protein AYI69_g7414 [Smittium culicis]|uniref:Uncharacterized protein n=1 Tax=Smittium culicis TaxID=133412 RepID=A0A1R1XS82_9FUNG|nr:hypothetical protein AYI69_g7414 [Smittium culicis]